MMNVVMLIVDTPGAIKLNVILLIVTFFIFIRRVIMVSVLLVSAIMLNITLLNVDTLGVVASLSDPDYDKF